MMAIVGGDMLLFQESDMRKFEDKNRRLRER
jgi:hypothetical protein